MHPLVNTQREIQHPARFPRPPDAEIRFVEHPVPDVVPVYGIDDLTHGGISLLRNPLLPAQADGIDVQSLVYEISLVGQQCRILGRTGIQVARHETHHLANMRKVVPDGPGTRRAR